MEYPEPFDARIKRFTDSLIATFCTRRVIPQPGLTELVEVAYDSYFTLLHQAGELGYDKNQIHDCVTHDLQFQFDRALLQEAYENCHNLRVLIDVLATGY